MGMYFNPGNSGFAEKLNTDYIDKTELISVINETIDTNNKLTCVSRPRRFGKSYAAQMLCAYYDRSCDSHRLFSGYKISKDENYETFINNYNVIYLDMTNILGKIDAEGLIGFIEKNVAEEIIKTYPEVKSGGSFDETLVNCVEYTGCKIVMIIDEWDAPIREVPEIEKDYLRFLRMLFKSSGTTSKIFAAVYMTGILPIKKDGSQSAISDFKEYTMVKPRRFGEYVGFTENEVKSLCDKHGMDFRLMRKWYDGYELSDVGSIYNPNSVMQAIYNDDFDSYWTETSAAEGLMSYISKPYNGMTKTIAELIGGVDVSVDTAGFANDLVTFRGRDDVLTLMIHLGYLAYDSEKKTAHIPNEEIRLEFQRAVRNVKHEETAKRLFESEQLFADTVNMNEEAVAAQIEKMHREETSPLHYNKEDSLRSVIKLAYYTYKDNYLQWEELPSGDGFADVVYLPKQSSGLPALVIELKWNKSAEGAIQQIKQKHYPEALKGYGSEVLLVGINYDKEAAPGERKHSCKIEKFELK